MSTENKANILYCRNVSDENMRMVERLVYEKEFRSKTEAVNHILTEYRRERRTVRKKATKKVSRTAKKVSRKANTRRRA